MMSGMRFVLASLLPFSRARMASPQASASRSDFTFFRRARWRRSPSGSIFRMGISRGSSVWKSFTPTMMRSRVSNSRWKRAEASAISFWK